MKTFIITGANGHLGQACVKKMLAEGHQVIAVDAHDNNLAFAADNAKFSFGTVDLGNEDRMTSFIQSLISKHGRINGALMLAGGFAAGSITETSGEAIEKMIALNFNTAYFLVRPLLAHMEQHNEGRLVFIGARPALAAAQGKDLLAYALSKSLLFKLAEFINEAGKDRNISAAVVVPSTIDTPVNRKSMPDADPTNWVTPEALAENIAFLVSEKGDPLREVVLKLYNNS